MFNSLQKTNSNHHEVVSTSVNPMTEISEHRYSRLRNILILLGIIAAIVPLIVLTMFSYNEYEDIFLTESTEQVTYRISNIKHALEFFIDERLSAMTFLAHEKSMDELKDNKKIASILSNLKHSFNGFVDLGLIDSDGNHRAYAGPYQLLGKNYKDQHWFEELQLKDSFVSSVFMGLRNFPHFVIAVKHDHTQEGGNSCILRATLNTEMFEKKINSIELGPETDAFLINREGIVQTPSKLYGKVLEKCKLDVPTYSINTIVKILKDQDNTPYIYGYTYLGNSPYILLMIKKGEDFLANLNRVKSALLWFLSISVFGMIIIIIRSTAYMVKRLKTSDMKHAKALHDIQYTNKMASIGRLAAGVAHEINNPLAIINEKAGLLKDLANFKEDFRYKEKVMDVVDSIIKSVDRCSTITHRLLGFAKRMDVSTDVIDVELLLKEVSGFLEKEATLRNIKINYEIEKDMPSIESDRGQLQQVFLNILTNAFYAVKDSEGIIKISTKVNYDGRITIEVSDNGVGISKDNLDHIFEPFYTTKGKYGTGLGLSITYGIIQKLGGEIKVKSQLGKGTSFSVILPKKSNPS